MNAIADGKKTKVLTNRAPRAVAKGARAVTRAKTGRAAPDEVGEAVKVGTVDKAGPSGAVPRDLHVPLDRLVLGEANVRRVQRADGLEELAALIDAQGLLQRLSVVAQDDGRFAVVAGGRRLRALQLLAERGRLAGTHPVECRLCDAVQARQVSLAENSGREAMHPADQMVAFRQLIEDEHLSVAQVAQRFGVSVLSVERRLRLARLAPRFIAMYRAGEIDNDQLQALALIDDLQAQEAVWDGLRPHDRSAWRIRDAVTAEACSADSRLARFVGLDAYEAEGGAVRRDLFASGEDLSGIFLDDLPRLHALAMERLRGHAEAVRTEGWSWVEVTLDTDRAAWRGFGFEAQGERAPTPEEAQALAGLEALALTSAQALDAHQTDGDPEADDFEAREAQLGGALDEVEDKLEAARAALRQWSPEQLARAGALVRLDSRGEVVVERGLVRPADRAARRSVARGAEGAGEGMAAEDEAAQPSQARTGDAARGAFSERLMRDLSAHRTAALQAALLQQPHVALAALAHRMAETVFSLYGPGNDIVRVSTRVCGDGTLAQAATDHGDSRAAGVLGQAEGLWGDLLPGKPDALFAWLLAQPQEVLLDLLAYCTARSVDAIRTRMPSRADMSDALAAALGLDMADWWQPTQRHYLLHVSKSAMCEAVREATGAEVPAPLTSLKKPALAAHCASQLEGTRWLPLPLRARHAQSEENEEREENAASETAPGEGAEEEGEGEEADADRRTQG
ncbi:chromosome partitioning protein, ParB family [Variovorax sp. OK605]|nr:chromosome partitioning protein, ParB family [Variovorax sp. OK605]